MKNFFKKIWEWIRSTAKKAWEWLKALLLSVPVTKLYYFIAGLIVASAIAILGVDGIEKYPLIAVAFISVFAETVVYISAPDGGWKWKNFIATCAGGLIIQLIVVVGY